jgi:hypothetical protein
MLAPVHPCDFDIILNLANAGVNISIKSGFYNRSWKQRLFSIPWKPLKKQAYIIPDNEAYLIQGAMWVNPKTAQRIKDLIHDTPPTDGEKGE